MTDRYELVLSPPVMAEILDVLNRPNLRAKFPQITDVDVAAVIGMFEAAYVVEPTAVVAVSRDFKDDMFLACALTARAQYVVTEDKDLLSLGAFEGIQVVQPEHFIAALEGFRPSSAALANDP